MKNFNHNKQSKVVELNYDDNNPKSNILYYEEDKMKYHVFDNDSTSIIHGYVNAGCVRIFLPYGRCILKEEFDQLRR
jgi:hypothetical protein